VVTYLFDTAPFLWAVSSPQSLSVKVRKLIESGKSSIVVSVASLWEVMIKANKGLLPIPNPTLWLEAAVKSIDATVEPVRSTHIYALDRMPAIHRDPFDRLLIAQALAEEWVLVTCDDAIRKYPARTLW
jgi:PIN domain nuclease of toxin-antitoxin system